MSVERRPFDWIMVGLIAVVVLSPAFAIQAADWADGLEVVAVAALGGLAIGGVIAYSRFRGLTAHLLSLVYGVAWVGYLLISPLPEKLLRLKILALVARFHEWLAITLRGGVGRDTLLFIMMLSLIFWWLAYIAIWNTVRYQRIWRALLPPAAALLVNVYYYPGNKLAVYMMVYLLCALLYIVRSYTVLQEQRWLHEGIGFNSDVRFDLLRAGLVLAAVAIALAWVAPTAASSESAYDVWRRVEGPWKRIEDDFNRMFSTLRSQAHVYGNPFGRMLTLRGPRTLSDVPTLQVSAPSTRRYYWRGVVYDRYTGSGWINTDSEALLLDPWLEPKLPDYAAREEITQTVSILLPADTLVFAAALPRRASVPVRADARVLADGTTEYSQLISRRSLMRGASYNVVSALSLADIASLRAAGDDYPAWVRERYLQLPDTLPQAVRARAQDIAGKLDTSYDKASAIEAWLRANVVYDDQTPAPPQNRDSVDYFLEIRRGYCDYYASGMVVMLRSLGVPARVAVGYAQGKYDADAGVFRVMEKDAHSWVEVYFPKYGWIEFEPTAAQPSIERPLAPEPTPTATPVETPAAPSDARPPRDRMDPEDPNSPFGPGSAFRLPPLILTTWYGILGLVGMCLAAIFVWLGLWSWRGKGRRNPTLRVYGPVIGGVGAVELVLAAVWGVAALARHLRPGRYVALYADLIPWLAFVAVIEFVVIGLFVAMWVYERRGLGGLSPIAQVYARLLRFSRWLRIKWTESQTPHERGLAFTRVVPDANDLITQVTENYTREQYSHTPPVSTDSEQAWKEVSPRLWAAGVRLRTDGVRQRLREWRMSWDAFTRRMGSQFGG